MTIRLLLCFAVALFLGCVVVGADAPKPTDEDVQDVVLLLEGRPALLRLHLAIDGKQFRTVHRTTFDDYLATLFAHLDANGDGTLVENEARRTPPPFKLPGDPTRNPVNVAFNYRVVDEDDDGKVSRKELMTYQREYAGGPVQIQAAPRVLPQPLANEWLFLRLDMDKDGKLTRDELAAASRLFSLDEDGNDLLTPQELAPAGAVRAGSAPAPTRLGMTTGLQPPSVLFPVSADDRGALAAALLARYGRGTKKLTRQGLGLSEEAFARLDTDRDSTLDAGELERFADRTADLDVMIRLGKREKDQPALQVVRPERGPAPAVADPGNGTVVLTVGSTRIELHANEGSPTLLGRPRQRYTDLFRAAAGKKDHLTLDDARQGSFFPTVFSLLDRDGDGKLTERELAIYLDGVQARQAALVAATPAMVISDRGGGLFDLLDRNRDGQLSLREVREAPRVPGRLGRPTDKTLSREDLAGSYQMVVGLGQATFGRGTPGPFTPNGLPMLTLDWAGPGQVWFQKMDRNHDGDLSLQEFLGPPEIFRRLDVDGDGLISQEEAERADAVRHK